MRKFFDDGNYNEQASIIFKYFIGIILAAIAFFDISKSCKSKPWPDIEAIKQDSFDVRVKSIGFSRARRSTEIKGESLSGRDTTLYLNEYREFSEIKTNDTLVKRKGEVEYKLKSVGFVETKTYYLLEGKWVYELKKISR